MSSARGGALPSGVVLLTLWVLASPVASQAPGHRLRPISSVPRVSEPFDGLVVPAQEVGNRWIEGAVLGAVLGGVGGLLLYEALAPDLCDPNDPVYGDNCEESGLTASSSAALGAGLGALIGGLVGKRFQAGFSAGPLGTASWVIDVDRAGRLIGRVSILATGR